jgi:hypothetical protein
MSPNPPKPSALPVQPDSIPAGLQTRLQWVVWKYEFQPTKNKPCTKVPYNPKSGYKASTSDPSTWGTFEEALALYQDGRYDGIGYVFSNDDPYCGIDLDDCRTPEDGSIVAEKLHYVDQMASYTEVSTSSTGLHIIIEGRLPGGGRKDPKQCIEVYDRDRYFCVTGHKFDGMPAEPQPRQAELDSFHAEVFGSKQTHAKCDFEPDISPLTAGDQQILEKAFSNPKTGEKVNLLFNGQFEEAGYPSQSEADLALCNYLAFWFKRNPVAIDKVFRTSKLYRAKWDEKHYGNGETYGQHTIQMALEAVTGGYSGTNSEKTTPSQSPSFEGEPYDIFGIPALTGKPEWPSNVCPQAVEVFAQDAAERIGVDTAMVALQAIGMAAIATHDGFQIQPKQNDTTWTEPPILWIGVVGDPGQKKSPAQAAAKRPLQQIEKKLNHAYKADMEQYERNLAAWKKAGEKGTPPVKPIQFRLSTDDTTVEALRMVLGENTRGVGIIKDELGAFLASFGAYRTNSKAGSKDRGDYCELYQGAPKWIDRVQQGAVYVPHWGASIVGNIQPGPVKRLMGNITDDGLVARFIVAHCEKSGRGIDRAHNKAAIETYENVIKRLVKLEPKYEIEAFTFAPQAQRYLEAIRDLAESMKCLPDTSDALKAHLNKIEGMFCRLTLVYHMIEAATVDEYPAKQISEDTARMAATLMADFLFPNSLRFYAETIDGDSHNKDARWVAGYLLSRGLETITKRELMQAYRPFKQDPKLIQTIMYALYAANWVEERDHKRSGEVTSWTVNPAAHTKFNRRAQEERERRAAERKKIDQVVRMFWKGRE